MPVLKLLNKNETLNVLEQVPMIKSIEHRDEENIKNPEGYSSKIFIFKQCKSYIKALTVVIHYSLLNNEYKHPYQKDEYKDEIQYVFEYVTNICDLFYEIAGNDDFFLFERDDEENDEPRLFKFPQHKSFLTLFLYLFVVRALNLENAAFQDICNHIKSDGINVFSKKNNLMDFFDCCPFRELFRLEFVFPAKNLIIVISSDDSLLKIFSNDKCWEQINIESVTKKYFYVEYK